MSCVTSCPLTPFYKKPESCPVCLLSSTSGSFPGQLGGWLSRTLYHRPKVHLRKAPKPAQEGCRYLEANVLNCHRKEYGRTCAGFEAPWSEWWGRKIRGIAPKNCHKNIICLVIFGGLLHPPKRSTQNCSKNNIVLATFWAMLHSFQHAWNDRK